MRTPIFFVPMAAVAAALCFTACSSDKVYNTNGFVMTAIVKDSITVNKNGQCQVRWGQGSPYNRYCPTGCPTGCVATAVAQLMSIYKYPSSYGAFTFNWDEMIADTACTDIPRLMQLLGLPGNLDMKYTTDGSYSNLEKASHTLQNFGYSHHGICADYNADVVMNHVLAGLPVLMGGFSTKYIYSGTSPNPLIYIGNGRVGHAWLVDGGKIITITIQVHNFLTGEHAVIGPNTAKYIHCNFGWGDKIEYNGLFLTNNIDTEDSVDPQITSGITFICDNYFQFDLTMLTGISPQ